MGSAANRAAAAYIGQTFSEMGLEVEQQTYPCTDWVQNCTRLERDGLDLPATANAFSLACDVTAPIVPAGSIADLERLCQDGPTLPGIRILLLYGDLVRAPIAAKAWFLKDERDIRIVELIEKLRPPALLAPPTATDYLGQATEDWELDLSAATVTHEVALKLLNEPEKMVHLVIDSSRQPGTASNILARTDSQARDRLVICAHFDTKINTAGATDNACGAACLLALAERLHSSDLPFGIEYVAFNGEEYLPLGDDEYLRRSEKYFKRYTGLPEHGWDRTGTGNQQHHHSYRGCELRKTGEGDFPSIPRCGLG